jgi:hypothetical protein
MYKHTIIERLFISLFIVNFVSSFNQKIQWMNLLEFKIMPDTIEKQPNFFLISTGIAVWK